MKFDFTTQAVLRMAILATLLLATCAHGSDEKGKQEDECGKRCRQDSEQESEQDSEPSDRERARAAAHSKMHEIGQAWRAVLREVGLAAAEKELAEMGVYCLLDLFIIEIVHSHLQLQDERFDALFQYRDALCREMCDTDLM